MSLLQPKDVTIKTAAGEDKAYILSKFPAIQGREIVTQYPLSALPKLGDYKTNEQIMLKILSFVGVTAGGTVIPLNTQALIANHVPDWETLGRIEVAMMEYNCSFFQNGGASIFFEAFAKKVPASISKILTGLQAQLSQKDERPS